MRASKLSTANNRQPGRLLRRGLFYFAPAAFLSSMMILFFSQALLAKTFIREHYYRAGKQDTQLTARAIALHQVKSRLIEEVGTYIESAFESTERESKAGSEQFTKHQIVSITAGITETKILEEKWDGKTYYIKAEIEVDVDDTKRRITEISGDRSKMREIEEINRKADDALREIEALKKSSGLPKRGGGAFYVGLDLPGTFKENYSIGTYSGERPVDSGAGVAIGWEYEGRGVPLGLGFGAFYQLPRTLTFSGSATIGFSPLYLLGHYYVNDFTYIIGRLGYSMYYSKNFTTYASYAGGLYYAFGLGIKTQGFTLSGVYSVNKSEGSGFSDVWLLPRGPISGTLTYSQISILFKLYI
ncbi:MAG: hypothetical protein CVU77_02825 [Elusimicrobia bacterium HGW-Elusimicrobia-1]|jgi:hypothetical protein|nr:MAG: hypothetical protein CVU77_02825 [Elusimicrobia bacterium HGW-Elusimicrobia-1]